jgi:hypothetical protein
MTKSGFDMRSVIWAGLCAVACCLPLAAQTTEESKEDVSAREEYFWAQRSYPSTVRPYEQMQRAFTRTASQLQARFSISVSSGVPGGWRSLGPNGIFGADNGFFSSGPMLDAGRVTAVAPSPAGGALFIGTASGGVWRSSSGGYWIPLTDSQCNLTIGAVTVDAADPNVVYAGTGEYNVNSWGCGILRSIDGGTSWAQLGASSFRVTLGGQPNGSAAFAKILVSRPAGGTVSNTVLLGATNVGVYRSQDGGTTWSFILSGASASLVAHPTRPGVVFAGNSDNFTASRRGLYKSVDNGASWALLPQLPGIDVSNIRRIELATTAAAPDLVYALVGGTDSKLLGIFLWDDAAGTWKKLSAGGLYTGNSRGDFGAQAWYDLAIAIDPRDANRVYVAGVRAFRSTDGGATFNPMGMEIHCDWHVIGIDPLNPDILYAGTDGGAFVSTDRGDTWASRNAGLTITQYYPGISASPSGSTIMGGAQDLGTHFFTGSTYWNGFLGGDGGYTAINYDNPAVRYAETQWLASGPNLVRFDAVSASSRVAGIGTSDRHAFIPPYVMDPIFSATLYFGTHRLYKTVNEGGSWAPISFDLSRGSGYITTIAVAKSDPGTIYVGSSDGMVSVTRDGGVTFIPSTNGLPNRWVTHIAVDPADATHALLTVSGFASGHVFETKNAGVVWTDISAGLADAPTNAVAFVPGVGIMVGTDVGVFQAPSPGAAWINGPAGIPNVIVYDLIYAPGANLLLAGTYGRGMFAYTVGGETPVLRGDVNADATVDAFDALLIQQSLIGILPAGTAIYPRGDADCNQMIQTADAVFVLRSAVGLASPGICVNTVK